MTGARLFTILKNTSIKRLGQHVSHAAVLSARWQSACLVLLLILGQAALLPHVAQHQIIKHAIVQQDANGNVLTGNGRTYTYTAANRQKTITTGATTITYNYDDAHQRTTQAAPEGTTIYLNDPLGVRLEKFTGISGDVQWNEYLFAGDEAIGVRFNRTGGPLMRYYIGDHLGSVSVITDEAGAVAERLSYDPWGKRRYATGADDTTNSITSQTTRGFTNHEHISNIGLINMNARTYDPVIGRFTSPDSLIEDYFKGQILNRYSYVGNNPLSFTDPTGHGIFDSLWKSPIFKMVVVTAAILTFNAYVLAPYLTSACFANGMAALASMSSLSAQTLIAVGVIEGAISGAVLSGNLSGAWQGAASGAIFSSIGSFAQNAGIAEGSIGKVALSGAGGGVSSVIRGGNFQSGFLAAGFSEFAGPHIEDMKLGPVGSGVARSMAGGTASKLGGGKFENGAITSSFQYLYNACLDGHCDGSYSLFSANTEQWLYNNFPPYKYGACMGALFSGYSSCTNADMLGAAVGTMGVAAAALGVPYAVPASSALNSNPFVGRSAEEVESMFLEKGFEPRGPDPLNGRGGYVNPETGRSYHIDMNNSYNEPSHIDVNRLGNSGLGDKAKYFLDGGRELK